VQPLPATHGFLGRHRFVVLFGLLVLFYVLVPILHHARDALHPAAPPLVEGILFIALLSWAVVTVSTGRAATIIAVLLGLSLVVLWVGGVFVGGDSLVVARYGFGAGFFAFAIWMMLLFIFASRRVTFNTVCASLCVYLLLGLVWALAYSAVDVLSPGAFTWTVTARPAPVLRVGRGDAAVLYFSFATLTTLGYGDIVPTAPLSRMLASVEAVAGQLYLAVLVARLVGLHIVHSIEQGPNIEPHPNGEAAARRVGREQDADHGGQLGTVPGGRTSVGCGLDWSLVSAWLAQQLDPTNILKGGTYHDRDADRASPPHCRFQAQRQAPR
jgi:hypothetical protein